MGRGRPSKIDEYERDFWHGETMGVGPDAKVGERLIEASKLIEKINGPRLEAMKVNTSLYRDRPCSHFTAGGLRLHSHTDELTYNVVKSCTDTVVAKIGLHEPSPHFGTFGAGEDLQEKARGMEKATMGVLQNQGGWHEALMAFKDSCLAPVGVVKTFDLDDDIMLRRLHPSKVLWDIEATVDARRPSVFYEIDECPRGGIMRQFPKMVDYIRDAPHVADKGVGGDKRVRDLVRVVEGFKEGTKKSKGRHTIAVSGCTLLDEEWEGPAPYEFTRWTDDTMGFDGLSIAHELAGIQEEINSVLDKLRANGEMLAVSYYLKPKGGEVDDEAFLTDKPFRKVEYVGQAPNIVHPPIANQQIFDYLERLYARAFELVGLSQFSATSKKPADLESGAALRAYLDVETVRFSVAQKSWENLFVALARQIVRACRRLAKRNPKWASTYFGKDKRLEKIEWSKVNLDDDQFQIMVQPMSALPLQPSARLSKAAEMRRDQVITQEQFNVLADMPDLEKLQRLTVAPYEDLERTFEVMLKKGGPYIKPLEFQRLDIGVPLCQSYWSRAACDEAPQDVLDRLETWMVDAKEIQEAKMQQQLALQQLTQQLQQTGQAMQGGGPGGPPPDAPPGGPGMEQPPGAQPSA